MVFVPNDPKTKAAAKKGGKTGKKHFETISKAQQSRFGKLSGKKRRELKQQRERAKMIKDANKTEDQIMSDFIQ